MMVYSDVLYATVYHHNATGHYHNPLSAIWQYTIHQK